MKKIAALVLLSLSLNCFAQEETGVSELVEQGRLADAMELLEMEYNEGNKSAALELGRLSFLGYDFPEATRWYGLYKKEVKEKDNDLLMQYERQLADAEKMLERVQEIVIIDSLTVSKEHLLSHFRLPKSAGRFLNPSAVRQMVGVEGDEVGYGFGNETGESVMWSQPDSTGMQRIVESIRLVDGTWSEPIWSSTTLNGVKAGDEDQTAISNAAYPFLLDDGQTLYFASDAPGSIGGYDIYLATRDSSTGDYLQPQNMGMPFNSPYDDYMMAIDELNGIGWWATERLGIPGMVTIFIYELPEGRYNIDTEEVDDLVGYARIDNYRYNWNDENNDRVTELNRVVASMDPDPFRENDFTLPIPGGGYYHFWSDFKKSKAQSAMKKYLESNEKYEASLAELKKLRRLYAAGSKDAATVEKILKLEASTEKMQAQLKKELSDIYRIEFSK